MVTIKINNQTNFSFPKSELEPEAKKLLKEIGLKQGYEVSVALIKEEKIKTINSKRRNEKKSAGVLSFAEKDLQSKFYQPEMKDRIYLGEIFLCPAYIKKRIENHDKNFKQELKRYFKHGLLHLAGLDHKEMEKSQAELR